MKGDRFEIESEPIVIRHLESDEEARACARIMADSEPWITLRRDYDSSLALIRDPRREVYVALPAGGVEVLGFIIVVMQGAFVGYIQSIAAREDWRGRGLGTRLIAFAESRIFRETPNVFICASSFNERARALYARLGYETVGELRDYVVSGASELLMRKSLGPLSSPR
ncbi:MAG TPA: GNAT family N-acetyltransferase [Gemmatimonadaceae bacterium]|nr:GNAT family N-acetyltransferase [Gemmatimonadaceae bacterium]